MVAHLSPQRRRLYSAAHFRIFSSQTNEANDQNTNRERTLRILQISKGERELQVKLGRKKAMASSLTKWLVDPKKNWFAKQHMKTVSTRLRRYGLRYDDLYDPYYDLDIKEALNRLPREIIDARNQRLKRAMDLSMKHEYLPEDLQAMQTPFRSYVQDMLALVKRENAEREALGALPLYQRSLP